MVAMPGPAAHTRWLAYTVLVCAQAVRAYANRSLRVPVYRLERNGLLLTACVGAIGIQAAIPSVPAFQTAFGAVPLDFADWLIVGGVALVPAALAQVMRGWRHREWVA
jgi:hypothetical protein